MSLTNWGGVILNFYICAIEVSAAVMRGASICAFKKISVQFRITVVIWFISLSDGVNVLSLKKLISNLLM